MQDNLEYLQWAKRFWDQNYPGGDYDALARRKGQAGLGGGPSAAPKPSSRASKPIAAGGAGPRTRTPMGGANTAALQQENATLKESVAGLEKERDFYFSKLRDIELLVQQAVEEQPELEQDENGLIPAIQAILYATDVRSSVFPRRGVAMANHVYGNRTVLLYPMKTNKTLRHFRCKDCLIAINQTVIARVHECGGWVVEEKSCIGSVVRIVGDGVGYCWTAGYIFHLPIIRNTVRLFC